MPDTPDSLAERLLSEGDKSAAFWGSLAPQHWAVPVYSDGAAWTAHTLLAHFVSAEAMFHELLVNIAQGGGGAPEGFDIDAFNAKDVPIRQAAAPAELVRQFTALRQQTAALVAGMSPADLERVGRHPFLGAVPLVESIKLVYRHNQIHQRDLKRLIGPQGDAA